MTESTLKAKSVCEGCAHFNRDALAGKCAKGHGGLFRIQLGSKGKCLSRKPRTPEGGNNG